jgi:lycopene beta-cyclase
VTDINELKTFCSQETDSYTCDTNSIYNKAEVENQTKYPVLQHFIGWFIKSKEAVFNPDQATFMDFRWSKRQYRFMYCLPSTTEALLEYTLFSHDLCQKKSTDGNRKYENSAFTISK